MKRIHITLAQIQAFATVAEMRSFTIASEQLGMTQSAVSHAVAALEKELQVSLLERDRTGVFLTDIGQRVLLQAQEMLACVEHIHQETSAAVGLEAGKVRLGSFPSVSAQFLPKVLRQFRQRYPGIEVVLFEGTDDEVREWIHTRAVDVGVVVLPIDELETIPITKDEFLVVTSLQHPLAQHSQISIRQLAQEPFIMSKAGCKPLITAMFRKAKITPKIQCEVIDLRTIFVMVQEGMGATIVPEMALPSDRSQLHMMSLEPRQFRQLAFAVPSLPSVTPAVAKFLHEATLC
ncbi:LysR family transcriptional regulator [Oscillatoria sp. FACHB-1407]|uniref:LysR family transcriptional regulator n=1 Tax=Oscillatoria sp. FACHB-1407 TaxID=2692847 RepID=UPI001686DE14|nr:LysR family transcriptional regulator [Oscillatoria sp. FACHB-1407]MBD2462182.1 LysR family transcriptional regulator [Oscillatoria sp. FACHB-1407]